jgi:ribosomal protein S18 acetylase RimI-like enzyme
VGYSDSGLEKLHEEGHRIRHLKRGSKVAPLYFIEAEIIRKSCNMSNSAVKLIIRSFLTSDESDVIDLWHRCNLVVPQNDPRRDIAAKLKVQPELFIVGTISGRIVSTAMAGYDGHRGWVYYLAVEPDYQRKGIGRQMMEKIEHNLRGLGCQKINIQVRSSNKSVIYFYEHLGFSNDDVIGLGKRP